MPAVHHAKAERGEFCAVIFPNPAERLWPGPSVHLQHRLICCDCGLSHDFEFIIVETRRLKNEVTKMVRIAPRRFALQFRARRNERSTTNVRRKKQVKR